MLTRQRINDDQLYVAADKDDIRMAISGPHYSTTKGNLFVLSLNPGDDVDGGQIFAGDRDDALALARQVLQHAGFKDVEISYEATDAA